jgi:phytoene synthase
MMCSLLEVPFNDRMRAGAIALGEAMQLTNFLRDIGEDMRRGRIYIPGEDIERFHGADEAISRGETNLAFIDLMKFEIDRARDLYCESDRGISELPTHVRKPVRLARILYSRILDRIEDNGYDVFTRRARTSRMEKLLTAWRTLRG